MYYFIKQKYIWPLYIIHILHKFWYLLGYYSLLYSVLIQQKKNTVYEHLISPKLHDMSVDFAPQILDLLWYFFSAFYFWWYSWPDNKITQTLIALLSLVFLLLFRLKVFILIVTSFDIFLTPFLLKQGCHFCMDIWVDNHYLMYLNT